MPSDLDLGQKYPNELKANSVGPDQMAWLCLLIWMYTVHPRNKGVCMK
jgi:hypothetical protein